jgi:hypothetical protein
MNNIDKNQTVYKLLDKREYPTTSTLKKAMG